MISRAQLIDALKDIVALEMSARDKYEVDTLSYKNFDMKKTLAGIKKDEDRHIIMLNNLILHLEEGIK